MIKKSLLKGLLFACFLSYFAIVPCTLSSAHEKTYTITDTELTRLETNLETLKQHNKKKNELLTKQKKQLQEAKSELTKAKQQLQIAKNELNQANKQIEKLQVLNEQTQKSLQNANKYLQAYEEEQQQKIKSEKRQKHIWQLATVVMAVIVVTK